MPVSPESFCPETEPIVSGTSEAANHPSAAINAESSTVPQVRIQSSYAQLVDPNEGTKLSFVPPQLINGIKCNRLEKSEVESETIYWQNVVLCTVLGANPPFELPGLDIKYWGMESLSKIDSLLGIPIKTDRFAKDKLVLRYARLLVEMPIEGPFPEHIEFFNDDGVLIH
ncbi:hypothetical protein Cgig2_018597 [Carnegiea gigantea]|uniref:Uncharacterized protein n=1 Tax=Carnegiea gigantea TaxID=171969 RepID=A0A9Q1GJI1_9CARY|nr:hypothetical protein Cgig2_018597 [Carnegiea gigantea]